MKGVIDIFIVIPLSLSLSLTNHPLWEYTSGIYSIGSYSLLCINIIQNTREISEDHALTANHHQQPEWSLIYLKKKIGVWYHRCQHDSSSCLDHSVCMLLWCQLLSCHCYTCIGDLVATAGTFKVTSQNI